MDRNHRLDAPHNDDLSIIEQVGDRSGLSAVYHHAHNEWDGVELMSGEARAKKQNEDHIRITLALRRWFPIIGFLIPLPVTLLILMATAGTTYLSPSMSTLLIIPVFFGTALWAYVSYKSLKAVYKIFYNHSIRATPYLIAHVGLLLIAFYGVFALAKTAHNGHLLLDAVILTTYLEIASIALAGILLFIWTARKIPGGVKLALIGSLAALIGGLQLWNELM